MKKLIWKFFLLTMICCALMGARVAAADENNGLPVVSINTGDGSGITSKEEYVNASLVIQDAEGASVYDGVTEIKGHGNSTWNRFEKKAFKLKLDKSTDLFGMGKNKHWLLIANYIDPSCMRNKTSVQIAKILGADCLDCIWVDVVLNGEAYGNFLLYEQARIAEERVDIYDWEAAGEDAAKAIAKTEKFSDEDKAALKTLMSEGDMSWISTGKVCYKDVEYQVSDYYDYPENNGGFLFEIDNLYDEISEFRTSRDVPIMFKKPEYICTDAGTMQVAKQIVQDLENAFYSTDKTTMAGGVSTSYAELCDADSLAAYILTNEIMFSEFGFKSTYFYKDTGDSKIVFGPVWDFDWSADNIAPFGETAETGWYSNERNWFSAIVKDPYLAIKIRELYLNRLEELNELTSLRGTLSIWREQIRSSAEQNEAIWHYCRGFEEDWQTLVDWLKTRTGWINSQMTSDEGIVTSMGAALSSDLSFGVTGSGLLNAGKGQDHAWYGTEGGTYTLSVSAAAAAAVKLYVNGIPVSEMPVSNGTAVFGISAEWLTEETGAKNVLVFRTLNRDGGFTGMQFATLTLFASAPKFYTVTFEDYGSTYSMPVLSGGMLILPESVTKGTARLADCWIRQGDGTRLYPNACITVESDIRFRISFIECNSGLEHSWKKTDAGYVCSICEQVSDFTDWISMTTCTFQQSTRYGTVYKGRATHPKITVYYQGRMLTEGVEYSLKFYDNVNAGFGCYVVTGLRSAGFNGQAVLSFGIKRRSVDSTYVKIHVAGGNVYTGAALEPAVTMTLYDKTLVQGVDYTLSYSENTEVGLGAVTITGIGNNMEGTTTRTFEIVYAEVPQNLQAVTSTDCSNRLTWDAAYEAEGYLVYRSTASSGTYTLLGTSRTNSYQDSNAVPGRKYYYKVATLRERDGESVISLRSESVFVTTEKLGTAKLSAAKRTYNSLTLSWTAVAGAEGYRIYRATSGSGTYSLTKTVTGTSCTLTGLTSNQTYYFKIKAYVTVDGTQYRSSYSDCVSAKTTPLAVTGLSASAKKTGITLTWNKVASVSGYKIYRLNPDTGTYVLIATVSSSKLTYTDTSCKAGTTCSYKVRAYKTVGEKTIYGGYSAVVKGKRSK